MAVPGAQEEERRCGYKREAFARPCPCGRPGLCTLFFERTLLTPPFPPGTGPLTSHEQETASSRPLSAETADSFAAAKTVDIFAAIKTTGSYAAGMLTKRRFP